MKPRVEHGLFAAVSANLLLLVWYKYFFPTLTFLQSIGLQSPGWVEVALPLGISFFTFTQIAYLVDLSQGAAQRQGFVSYVLFVTFFPHLIAGPIIHHAEMMPQFEARTRRGLRADDMALGMTWFVLGLSKKVLIADRLGPIADALYAQPSAFGFTAAWIGVLCYAMQLYFDFSGYSDMALGLGRMFSIQFPFNFNSPYKARNIIDFWARWHMTLTRWLTAYLYNPIALSINRRRMALGKKMSKRATKTLVGFFELVALPTLITISSPASGMEPACNSWSSVLLHGIYLTMNHAWRIFTSDRPLLRRLMPWPLGMALTAAAVLVGQVFFRAASVGDAVVVLQSLVHLHGGVALAQWANGGSDPGDLGLSPQACQSRRRPCRLFRDCLVPAQHAGDFGAGAAWKPKDRGRVENLCLDAQSEFGRGHDRVVYSVFRVSRREQELPLLPILIASPIKSTGSVIWAARGPPS